MSRVICVILNDEINGFYWYQQNYISFDTPDACFGFIPALTCQKAYRRFFNDFLTFIYPRIRIMRPWQISILCVLVKTENKTNHTPEELNSFKGLDDK